MAKRIAGICYVKVDGQQLSISGGLECPAATVKRENVMAVDGPAGLKETAMEPYVKLSALFTSDFPLTTLQGGIDMTVTAEMPNGKVYTLSGAFIKGDTTVKADDGTVDLEFGGSKGVWQ
ncbi:phage tail tube protein [Ampullimonas aquatilis]|uniref:phage tail tube protein n=1 Tax=Ampullimonas aquatilis TaxID=1341549 RepID=UPI003C71BFE6